MTPVRVRMAPSPTGYFHVGSARTALFNWLFARQQGGAFVLRIEDTDALRNRPEHIAGIERAMRWLGLDWDEGPYFQSQRGHLYDDAIDRLLGDGHLYACDCTPDQVATRNKAVNRPPGYDSYCRDRGLKPAPGRLLRFRTPDDGTTTWPDLVRGDVTYENRAIEDFSVRKSSGQPLFILANVVDDGDMAITHVVRGEDHVPNTPKYLLLWQALQLGERPAFAHLPLLVNASRQKLSKRRDKVALEDYRDEGYLPEAMVNYLALLGWSPGNDRELLTRDQLVNEFRLDQVKSAPAFFDEKKLSDVNANYLRAMPAEVLVERAQRWLAERWSPLAGLVQERARTLSEVYSMVDFLYSSEVKAEPAEWAKLRRQQPAFTALLAAAEGLLAACDWEVGAIREAVVAAGESAGVTNLGKAQAPVRLAVTGRTVGPPLFEALALLGRNRTVARVTVARRRAEEEDGTTLVAAPVG